MCQAIRQQGVTLRELLPPTDMLHLLMMHPLRVQVSTHFYIFYTPMCVGMDMKILCIYNRIMKDKKKDLLYI